ncbi:sushi, von Willebrand factor type A, EGF and pentraxin domain-containing protein 1-like isoform X2 [Apostichopus japonicus]|uniref:sushi, von Willebrand factor type A, EGF and pentraxin domain-containing protein 1-like isoform X2 n=1 Tax=Stichopus japonicus TaxID=307972 RepID=UPI003AB2B941
MHFGASPCELRTRKNMHTQLRNCRLFSNFVTSVTFLLKCVSIVNADCKLPPTYDNAEFQILPSTTSETTAVYNCKLGFYISGRADFVVLVCGQENEWIGPDVDCTNKLTCPNPPYPAYGSFYATSKDLTYESNITYTCNEGYTLEGPRNTQCSLTGEWVYNDDVVEVPLCKNGKYANYFNWAPDEPSNDHENCVYLSNLHGAENAHEWNDESCSRVIIDTTPPMQIFAVCEAEGHCSDLSTSFKNFPYEGKCIIFLDDSPRNQASAKTKCWNDFGGILVEIRNDALQMLIENFIDTNISSIANWWIGLEEELIARTWSWVDGERIENYFWGNGEPNGISENCLDVLPIFNYRWNDNNCGIDSNYICQYGESKCGNPGVPLHGNISVYQEAYAIGDSVLFSCDGGYVLSDHSLERISCQNDTTWNQPIPSCEKINCSESVPVVQNAMYYIPTNSTSYRGVVVYQCNTDYLLTGYPASECQEDGTWSDPNVTCIDSLKITTSSTRQMMTSHSDEIIDGTTTLRSGSSTIRQSTTHSVTSLTPIKVTATSLQITEHETSRKVTETVSKQTVTESEEPNAALIVGVSVSSAVIVIVVAVVIVVLYLERTEKASGFDLETNEDNGFMHPNPAYEDLATINSREPKKPAENIYQANDDKPIINY